MCSLINFNALDDQKPKSKDMSTPPSFFCNIILERKRYNRALCAFY